MIHRNNIAASARLRRRHRVARLIAACALGLFAPLAAAKSFVWTVSDEDSTLYLVGSMHLLPDEAYPLPRAMTEAYAQSSILVLETDLDGLQSPATQLNMMRKALAADAPPMRERLGERQYAQLSAHAQRLGVPLQSLDAMRDWFASIMLELAAYQDAGFKPERGLDMYFAKAAARDKKVVVPLEQIDMHLELITGMSDATGRAMLESTIQSLTDEPDLPKQLFEVWRSGDVDAMAELMQTLRETDATAYERLLTGRNKNWMPPLLKLLGGSQDVIVVVGAAHMAGDDGLIDLFEQRGFRPVQR